MEKPMDTGSTDSFFKEYTSQDSITKYTRATAGYGISYLLDHDYKGVYDDALALLPKDIKERGIKMLEFGCGGGMNLVHLVSALNQDSMCVAKAIGTDFSPVLIDAAKREANSYLREEQRRQVEFYVAKNESLINDLSAATGTEKSRLNNSFHFMVGVNTVRYCHRAKKELDCARDIANLLVPGGVCVVIDMNDRFLFFKSALKNRFLRQVETEECRIPTLEEYTAPFRQAGLDVVRSEHFCWIPHSSGQVMSYLLKGLSPILNAIASSRAMRSLVVLRKPVNASNV
jgi:2-polyprenyl-3-methyl-5-hydroxy-6-metoxy-1,4-benzoquinol methylase